MFPLLITFMIYGWGWQETLFVSAVLVLLVFIPVVRGSSVFMKYRNKNESTASLDIAWTQRQVLKSKAFYMIVPSIFMLSMIATVLFFYQVSIARYKGWSPEWLAACFIGYAAASSSFMLLSGSWIDRFRARRLFPYYMVPLALGILLMILCDHPWVAPIYMILLGISVGFGSTIKSAVQAEIFGVTSLGAVRALFSTISVVSTAAGPALFGLLLDHGFTFRQLLWLSLILVVIVMIQSFRVLPVFTRKRIYVRLRR